jgi:hypothetical protein
MIIPKFIKENIQKGVNSKEILVNPKEKEKNQIIKEVN